jgi:hypothetical protein
MEQMNGIARVTLVFLGACRDNPFKLQTGRGLQIRGLGEVSAAVGTLVVFATAPGSVAADGVGANSPFTSAMLRHMEEPGVEIRDVLSEVRHDVVQATRGAQVPWENSALEGRFFLKASPKPTDAIATAAPPVAPARADLEGLFWQTIQNSHDPADFRAYLSQFPDGIFVPLAQNRLAALNASPPATVQPATPASAPTPTLAQLFAIGLPKLTQSDRDDRLRLYLNTQPHKAQAISLQPPVSWVVGPWYTSETAAEKAEEGCQSYIGSPCVLVAVDDSIIYNGGQFAPPSDMPRVHYSGTFNPERIPAAPETVRQRPDGVGYPAAPDPKAAAFHPWGRVFTAVGAATQRAAEEKALQDCNADPVRHGQNGPRYLYAIGNNVVFPRRLTAPPTN